MQALPAVACNCPDSALLVCWSRFCLGLQPPGLNALGAQLASCVAFPGGLSCEACAAGCETCPWCAGSSPVPAQTRQPWADHGRAQTPCLEVVKRDTGGEGGHSSRGKKDSSYQVAQEMLPAGSQEIISVWQELPAHIWEGPIWSPRGQPYLPSAEE